MTWQIIVPYQYFEWAEDMGGRNAADRSKDYPVVGKIYFATHASAMVLRVLTVNSSQLLFDESLIEVDSQWKGLWLSDLLDLRPQLKSFFSVRVVAALSTAEVLQRQRLDLPFYVEQYGVPQQYGVRKDKEKSGETDSRKGATERGFDVVQDNLAPSAECRQGLRVLPLSSSHYG